MFGRKWLVRGLVFSALGGLLVAGVLYQRWTNPAAVRHQVLAHLAARMPGANVNLGSARLRLLGGILLEELRLARRDDRDRTEFAYVPVAILYHDKEQLLDGKLVVRKMELQRPRLHLIRRPDGTWNLAGLLGPTQPAEQPLPTIVIQQGTLLLEDQAGAPGTPPIEIHNVNVTLVSESQELITVRADATCNLTGPLQAALSWQRDSGEVTATLEAPSVPVRLQLIERLAVYCPKLGEHARQLQATGRLHVQLGYHPDTSQPWSHDLSLQLTDGEFRHPQVPLALSHLKASARCRDGQVTLSACTADAGETCVELSGSADRPAEDTDFRGILKVKRLPLCEAFFERLPALQKLHQDFQPAGPVNLTCTIGRHAGQWRKHYLIQPLDLTAEFKGFRYPLQHLTGDLDLQVDAARAHDDMVLNLVGFAGGRPVTIKGTVRGSGPAADIDLDIRGDNIVIDDTLIKALPTDKFDFQKLARSFNAAGQVDFVATVRRLPAAEKFANRFVVRFHDATIRYEVFAYPLENVRGVLDIQPEHWEFHDFRGTHKGCEVQVRGQSHQGPNRDRLVIHIDGHDILLDDELAQHCAEKLKQTWRTFSPSGRIDFATQVTCLPNTPQPDIDLTVTARDCAIRPTFFPCSLVSVNGSLRYASGWVALGEFHARHGDSALALKEGYIYLKPEGGIWAKLTDVSGNPVVLDAEVVHALPPALQRICTTLELRDPLAFRTQLVVDSTPERLAPPTVWWDGVLALQDARARAGVPLSGVTGQVGCTGLYNGQELEGASINLLLRQVTLFGQPFQDVHGRFEIDKEAPDVLASPGLQARLYNGDIGGPVRVEFGSTVRYDLNLTALGVRLEEFGRQNNLGPSAQISGLAKGRLWLHGEGGDLKNLQGEGSLDVPSGRMYNLPLLLDLLKVPGLRVPDRTAFEEAHATFSIRGLRANISRVDLFGNAISLSGKGEMNLDGSDISLDFYAVWGRVVQMLPPVLDKIPQAISKQLLKIKMRGRVGDVQCIREPVPVVVEPLAELFKRMAGRQKPAAQPQ